MVLDGTGSLYDDSGWYLVSISWYCLVLSGTLQGQQRARMPEYLASMGRYWLVLGGTGSVWGVTGWYLVVLCQHNLVCLVLSGTGLV